MVPGGAGQQELDDIERLVHQALERLHAIGAHELIRVNAGRQLGHADLESRFHQDVHPAQRSRFSGRIGVKREDHLIRVSGEQLRLLRGEGRA